MNSFIQELVDQFVENWGHHSRNEIGALVVQVDSAQRNDALHAFVVQDVQQRLKRGSSVVVSEYQEFGSEIRRLVETELASFSESTAAKSAGTTQNPLSIGGDVTMPPQSKSSKKTDSVTIDPGANSNPVDRVGSAPYSGRFLHFELIEEIARGGMGVVYKARDTKLNRVVALKMIISGKLASEEEKFRFNLEAEAAAKLDHPGITPIFEVGEHDGQLYFAMKLVEGGSLADHLESYQNDFRKSARLVADISHAIHHAHQRGTLHRDLKPNNILLDLEQQPLVTDFGLAKNSEHDSDVTRTGVMLGTPGYMPPEQVSCGKNVTTAADVYSLGAILFAVLTGRPPFVGETAMETVMKVVQDEPPKPKSINSRTPLELDLIVDKCLQREPDSRYESAAALATDLENWLIGDPISVRAPSVASLARQWMKRNIRLAATSLLVGVLVACVATPLCLIGFGQNSLPGEVYQLLPNAESPPLAGMTLGLPKLNQSVGFFYVIFAVFLVSSAGAIAVALSKPSTMNDAVGVGIIAGIAVGISLFLLQFGWLIGGSVASSYTAFDLNLLAALSQSDSPTGADAEQLVLWHYPDLANVSSPANRNAILRKKIMEDHQLLFGLGNIFAAILTSMFFLPVVLAAGYYFRLMQKYDSRWRRFAGHLEFVLVAALLSLSLIWLLVTVSAWILPRGTFNGPEPSLPAMMISTLFTASAVWTIWNFEHWTRRVAMTAISIVFFGWFASAVFVEGTLHRDVFELVGSEDYRGAAERFDLQTRQGGTWTGSSASAIVMADLAGDKELGKKYRKKLDHDYVQFESAFQPTSAPTFLEAYLLTPESNEFLPRLARLIDYVETFSTENTYGTHRHQVLALAEYRAGNLEKAQAHLDLLPMDDLRQAVAEKRKVNHQLFDDFKGLVIQSMILFDQGKRDEAIEVLKDVNLYIQRIRAWSAKASNRNEFGLVLRAYYSLEVLFREAIGKVSGGDGGQDWIRANLNLKGFDVDY